MKHWWAVIILGVALGWGPSAAMAADADEERWTAGLSAGASAQWMIEPTDDEGEPTVLYGSAFRGPGMVIGPSLQIDVGPIDELDVAVELEGLYGYQRASGFARHSESGQIDVTLSQHVFRFPAQLVARGWAGDVPVFFGAGLEPVVGVHSASSVETDGVDVPIAALATRPVTSVGALASLGIDLSYGEQVIPVSLRVAYDPSVPESSRGRLEGYESDEEPGEFGVQFDLTVMMTVGFRL